MGENRALGEVLSYDDKTIYIRAATKKDYDFLLSFFTEMGMSFVSEKHGKGPRHHSCQKDDRVFEIYPSRKNSDVGK